MAKKPVKSKAKKAAPAAKAKKVGEKRLKPTGKSDKTAKRQKK